MSTYREAHDDLVVVAERRRLHRRLRRQLEGATAEHAAASTRLEQLEQTLAEEEADVKRLEGRTVTALAISLFGRLEQRRAKEASEAEVARLRYESHKLATEQLGREVDELRSQLDALGDVEGQYAVTFTSKAQGLIERGDDTGARVAGLAQDLASTRSQVREIDEARAAGRAARRYLASAEAGIPDENTTTSLMPIGTIMMPLVIDNELDRHVEQHLREAQRWTFRFSREIADLDPWSDAQTQLLPAALFVEHYVDDLLRPGATGDALDRTRAAVRETRQRIDHLLEWLDTQRRSAVAHHAQVEAAYVAQVEHA